MKWFSFGVSCVLTVALLSGGAGCKGEKKSSEGAKGEKLTVQAPADISMKQGETKEFTVNITREKFNDPVDLKFNGLPDGVTIMEDNMKVSKDATSAKFNLKASDSAKVADDQVVTVSASGGGMKPEATFKVSIKAKGTNAVVAADKKLTLTAPGNTSVKQGEDATINVAITRDKFNDPVKLDFKNLPKGVKVMEKDWEISKDATSSKLTLHADADAPPVDDQVVTVSATGGGLTQEHTFKVSVKKKS